MEVKKIFVIDDHKIVRDAIRSFFLGQDEFKISGEAATGAELLKMLPESCADLYLLDLMLPDLNGLELIAPIRKHCSTAKVLVLTAEMDEDLLCASVEQGADGFLHKDTSAADLLYAMRVVLSGEPWFGQNLSQLVYRSFCRKVKEVNESSRLATITEREQDVIRLLGEGLSVKEIADQLCISPRTVESHKNNLLEKLELRNTVALIKYGIQHKLIAL